MVPGRGVDGVVEGGKILAGNLAMIAEAGVDTTPLKGPQADFRLSQGDTLIHAAVDGEAAGFIALSNTIHEKGRSLVGEIGSLGAGRSSSQATAPTRPPQLREAGIVNLHAGSLPEDKISWIDSYQRKGDKVCMSGDGVNDAPALRKADLGIAMGGVGSDIAVNAADIVIVQDDMGEITHLIALSRRMMRTIRINLTFSMTLNLIGILLAMTGILNPVVGALVHNAGSGAVIINSAFLLKWRREEQDGKAATAG